MIHHAAKGTGEISERARQRILVHRGEPLFYADWLRSLFIHFEVEAEALQRAVPFELDLRDARAYLSLVAFTMRGMRPRFGGRPAAWLLKPIATHEFLNVRAYVKHDGEPGIHFLAEWLSNRLSVALGPATFGLPYRHGRLRYDHSAEPGKISGSVTNANGRGGALRYEGSLAPDAVFDSCESGTLDEFLLERYTAFTAKPGRGHRGFFRIWHPPWPQVPVSLQLADTSLLTCAWPWFRDARFIGANFSPGVRDVWMGRPHWL